MKSAVFGVLILLSQASFADSVLRTNLDVYKKCRGLLDDFGINKSCRSLEDKGTHWVFGNAGQRPFHGAVLRVDKQCRYTQFDYVNWDNKNYYYESHQDQVRVKLSKDSKKILEVNEEGKETGSSEKIECVDVI